MCGVARLRTLVTQYAQQSRVQNSFSTAISKRLELMDASTDLRKTTFQFPLHQSDCHAFAMPREGQHVHGGVLTLLVEDITTMQMSACDPRGRKALTTDLNLSFLGVGKVGRTLQVDTEVLKVGSNLGVAEARVSDLSTSKLLAVGRHTMMFVGEDGGATSFANSLNSVFDV
eukprot:TRINITY_DN125790_c0_g1_i1.p1 TRINITY_DN125790_c0_g1~~TRINITY_DN125790_c0_g1_i1.p1  ORF type:complete len:172 (-),score=38.23 TRINITY_DN125790_c0_g1_i1:541-1056(-)